MPDATDIVLLTHNRLEHLVATVDALEQRTQAPYRLTIVDNASGPEVRSWLHANRDRFHQLLLLPRNEFLSALNVGIAATTSDPYMVSDPDLVVPDLDPCWLTTMRDIMDRHPDFGLLGIGLDQANLPPVQEPESIDASEIVDGEIVERAVGSVFTLIRRDALRSSYLDDWATCQSVARAGYRYGWAKDVRAIHLGWDDFRLYPGHLAGKLPYGEYREVQLIPRAPTLAELALAAPAVAETRRAGVADAAVLELTWSDPAVAAALPEAVAVCAPAEGPLPFADDAAGAVVLVDPPAERSAELVREACRVSAGPVIAIATLEQFGARAAGELAPAGRSGREATGPGDVPLALAARAASDPELAQQVGVRTLDHREQWLTLFAAGAFGDAERRLWIFERETPHPLPERVAVDATAVEVWQPVVTVPTAPRRPFLVRLRGRARREGRVIGETLRIRAARLRGRRTRSARST